MLTQFLFLAFAAGLLAALLLARVERLLSLLLAALEVVLGAGAKAAEEGPVDDVSPEESLSWRLLLAC